MGSKVPDGEDGGCGGVDGGGGFALFGEGRRIYYGRGCAGGWWDDLFLRD